MGVTLKDVAREAGVSVMTVSRVMNKKEYIAEETRRRVLEVGERLGYRPNQYARSLVTHKTDFVGMIVPDIGNPFFGDLVRAAEQVARGRGYSLLLGDTGGDLEVEEQYIEAFRNRMCDALVLVAPRVPDEVIHEVNADVPLVLVDRFINDPEITLVALDNRSGAQSAVDHLISLGHRRIAFIKGPENVPNSHLRYQGWRDALEKVGLSETEELIYQGEFERQTGVDAFHAFEKIEPSITAVFASNDLMAYGFVQAARTAGYQIPGDISIVGFDDIFLSELMHPPLTTVRYPILEMGTAAIECLLDSLGSANPTTLAETYERELKHELIVRESTAAIGTVEKPHMEEHRVT